MHLCMMAGERHAQAFTGTVGSRHSMIKGLAIHEFQCVLEPTWSPGMPSHRLRSIGGERDLGAQATCYLLGNYLVDKYGY